MNNSISYKIREAHSSDVPFMTLMLLEATKASQQDIELEKLADYPETEMYIKDWPRASEVGVIAESQSGEPIGAAWIRIFPESVHVVKYPMPELTIAVVSGYRRMGIASMLLRKLYKNVADRGIKEISLGVHSSNVAAIELYKKDGWVIDGTIMNGEYTMMSRFTD